MDLNRCSEIYKKLKKALKNEVVKNNLQNENISIRFKALTAEEAIGNPEDSDYPIIMGKEKIVEADFKGSIGHAFTDECGNADYSIGKLIKMPLDSNRKRSDFIAALNAIYRYLGLCDKTVHCKDTEPRECAEMLLKEIGPGKKVLLVGLQPRFLEFLAKQNDVRVIDLDQDNIGAEKFGIKIEPPENTDNAIEWCDVIFATGSTIVNCTIVNFLNTDKPVIFYGVTISATAKILELNTYCSKGH
ncbi:hypothetical protein KKA47_01260 [bacterium]|nr:hypothetical protein [bacterium]